MTARPTAVLLQAAPGIPYGTEMVRGEDGLWRPHMSPAEATAAGFLKAIIAEPDDDGRRLIFADWLEENGEEGRAEFVRCQVELAKAPRNPHGNCSYCGVVPEYGHTHRDGCRAGNLVRRERELLDGHWRQWAPALDGREVCANLCDPDRRPSALFRRGFPAAIDCTAETWCGAECTSCAGSGRASTLWPPRPGDCLRCNGTGRTPAHGPALVRRCPLERVTLTDREPYHARYLGDRWGWGDAERLVGATPNTVRPSHLLPHDVYGLLPEPDYIAPPSGLWDSERRALDAGSFALLAWARAQPVPRASA